MINSCILKTELRAACLVLNSLRGVGIFRGVGMGSLVGATRLLNDGYPELESLRCSWCLLFKFGLEARFSGCSAGFNQTDNICGYTLVNERVVSWILVRCSESWQGTQRVDFEATQAEGIVAVSGHSANRETVGDDRCASSVQVQGLLSASSQMF